jgi:hypothetical protein
VSCLPSTSNLSFEEWVLLRAFDPVNCGDVKCIIRINRNQNSADKIIRSKMQNVKNEHLQHFKSTKKQHIYWM